MESAAVLETAHDPLPRIDGIERDRRGANGDRLGDGERGQAHGDSEYGRGDGALPHDGRGG
jgi:hypothetical protein